MDNVKQKTLKVLVVKPHQKPFAKEIKDDLKEQQAIVRGHMEAVFLHENYVLICNEEATILQLEHNRNVNTFPIFGTFFVCRFAGEDFLGLTPQDEEELTKLFTPRNIFIS